MAAFALAASPAKADSVQQIDGGTQVGQEYYSATAPFDRSYIKGGNLTGNSFYTLDRIDVANTYGSDGYTNNIFETINDNSQINLNSGTFAGTIAKAKGYGSDVTLANGTYTGKLKLFAEDNLTVSGGTFGENTLSILDLRAHDITVTNALLNAGVSDYAVIAATKTLTGVDNITLHNAVFAASMITVANLTASDNTHIGFQNVLEKYTYTPEEGDPTNWYSAAHATLLNDVTVNNSTVVLNDTSKLGTGFIGVEIPVDAHDVEAASGATFFTAGDLTAAEKTASVEHIQNALSNAATNVPAPSMRYGSLPSDVREALDIDYLVGGTPLSDYVRAQLQAGGDIDALNDVVATALNAQFNAYATTAALQARIVAKIQAKLTAVVQDDTILAGDKNAALTTALANVLDTLSPEAATALTEDSIDTNADTIPDISILEYIAAELADGDNYVDAAAKAALIADLNGRINGALTADGVLTTLNNVDVTIHDSTVTMKDTSAIENNYGDVVVSGASAINVQGGTGTEPATYNTITAAENISFTGSSSLTVGADDLLEEGGNGSKLNMTATTGGILFEGTNAVAVKAGSTLNMTAGQGITYAKSGNFIIGSAAEGAQQATLNIVSAAVSTNYRTDYRDFWYDGGTDHHAQINTDDTPGKAHAGLYIDAQNPAVAALGATYGANTLVFEDAQLIANNADITGNLAFHADDHTATDNINNSFVSGNVTVANESGGAFTLNAATSTIGGEVNAYTGRYVFNNAVDPADDTLTYMNGTTTLNLGQVGKTVTTTGWAHPTVNEKYSTTNVTIATSTGRADDPETGEVNESVDGSITMTGGVNNLTIGNGTAAAVVNGNVAMTGKEANLIVSANATVTGNVAVNNATPAQLTLNGTIGGNATFTGNVNLAATASSGTVTGALALANDKTFDMQNGTYSTAYAGRYDHLTVGKITAGAAANPTILKLDVDTGSVSNTKNIDHFTLTNSGSTGKMVISSLRNEKYDSVNDLYTFDELWGLREFSMDVVGLGEGASSEGLTVTLDDALTAERSAAVSGGSLTNDQIKADNASWHRVLTETLAHASNFSTEIDWTLDHFSTYDKVTTKTTNLTLSEGCGSGQAGACTLTFTKTAEESIENEYVIGNTMVALNQQVGGDRFMRDVEANATHRFTVTEHLNTTGKGMFTITGMIDDEHPETVVSVIDMNSMNGFTVGADAMLNLNHVSFDNIQGAAGAGTDGKALTIAANGRAELDTVILAGDNLSAEKKSLIINNGSLAAEDSKIMLDNRIGSEAFIYGNTTLFSTTNAATAELTFFGADAVANEITNNGAMFLLSDADDPENIIGGRLTTNLLGNGTVQVDANSVLTLKGANLINQNTISGEGMTVIDNAGMTTEVAIASNITVNAEKSLTGVANLIGAAERTVTNDGTLTLTAGVTPGTTDQLAAKIVNNGTLSMTGITALADVENNTETFTVSGNVILNAKLTGAVPGANPEDPTTPAKATLSDGAVLTLAGTQNTNTITASAVGAATLKVTNDGTDAHALQNAGKLLVNTTITATEEVTPVRSKMVSDADMLGQKVEEVVTKIAVTNNGSLVLNGGANANDVKTAYADITTVAGATVSTANHIRLEGDTLGAGSIANTGVLTLAGANNENTIAGAGSIVIDSALTTTGALNQAVTVNAGKSLTAAADLIGGDVTNNGTVVLKEGTLAHAIAFGENGALSIVDGDANAETGVTSNVVLAKATIEANALLTINASNVGGAFVNNGKVNLTGGTLTKALNGNVLLTTGKTTFGTGADFTGAVITMTGAGTLDIGTNAMTATSVDGGTIFMTLTENAVADTLVNIAGVVNNDVALNIDNSHVSRLDVQHYNLTATDTGYNLTLTGAGRYAISTQEFNLEDALTMAAFDPSTWHGGDLYMLKLATVAEVAAEKQAELGVGVTQNERGAVQTLSDEVYGNLGAGQKAQFDQINTMLAAAVDAGNTAEVKQILKEVGAEKAPAVAQSEVANVGAVMNVVGNRLGGAAPAPAAGADHGRSGGNEFRIGNMSAWGQLMFNTAKLDKTDGFDSDSAGFALGFETEINDDFKAGIGYAFASTDLKTDRSKTDVDTHTAFLYGEYKPNNFYVNGVLSYGKSSYDEKAKVTGITADYDANTIGLQVMSGYTFGNWTPEAGLRYTNVNQKAYTNSLGVRAGNKTIETLTAVAGAKYAQAFRLDSALVLTPEAKVAFTYDLDRSNQDRSITLANGTGYVAEGDNMNRFGIEVGAGVSLKVNNNIDVGVSYEGKFKKDYSDHTGLLNFKYNF